jgi:hypothetical protein
MNRRRRLSYRCNGTRSQESAQEHWRGFTWQRGGWRCIYSGPWGQIQVCAASAAEGRRVIEHACSHAGIDPNYPGGVWSYRDVGGRFGRVATCRVMEQYGVPVVTARNGPDGPPVLEP